jgi:hypothetical protein
MIKIQYKVWRSWESVSHGRVSSVQNYYVCVKNGKFKLCNGRAGAEVFSDKETAEAVLDVLWKKWGIYSMNLVYC